MQSHLLHSRLLGCEQPQPWPYMRRLAANSITCRGKRPVPKYFSCDLLGNSSQVSHLSRNYSLFLIGGEAVLVLSPSPFFIPKDPTPPSFSELFQSALQQFRDFPGPFLVPSQSALQHLMIILSTEKGAGLPLRRLARVQIQK